VAGGSLSLLAAVVDECFAVFLLLPIGEGGHTESVPRENPLSPPQTVIAFFWKAIADKVATDKDCFGIFGYEPLRVGQQLSRIVVDQERVRFVVHHDNEIISRRQVQSGWFWCGVDFD
jgi:hypothetical protein